jgi:hypothetical protein
MSEESSMAGMRCPLGQATAACHNGAGYEFRFAGLFNSGRGYAFPSDAHGRRDLDNVGERARTNYFYARTVIGREFHPPVTCIVTQRAAAPAASH